MPSSKIQQLRLRDLLLLEHLAELGSMREVAERVHVTQPAITQAVQSLEDAFGIKLLERGRRGQRGVTLTEAGQAALAHLRIARREILAAQRAATEPLKLTLRLGVLPVAMLSLLPRVLAHFRQAMPNVEIQIVESSVMGLWRKLQLGELDAIVCKLPSMSEAESLPAGIAYNTIGDERLVVAAPSNHPASRLRKPTMKALLAWDWVLPPARSFTRLELNKLCVRAGIRPPDPVICCTSLQSALQTAAQHGLLTAAHHTAVLHYQAALDLKVLPIAWTKQQSEIMFACRQSSLDLPAVGALRESCKAAAQGPT